MEPSAGKIYLVGAGPGDPGLLTRRAWELITTAEVIVYDYLVNEALLADAPALCERIYVGKQAGFHAVSQEDIEAILVDRVQTGKRVVRLKGGDPFIFGRGGEEARRLAEAGLPFEIVPGITAALAAAAYAGIPLTHRDHSSSLCLLTGHENPEKEALQVNFRDYAQLGGTLCIYMGMGNLDFITRELMAGGLAADTPATVVEWATLPRQRSVSGTLSNLFERVEAAGLHAPAMIYVGSVACFQPNIDWFVARPLSAKRIVVTRATEQAGRLRRLLEEAGAEVLELPLIRIEPIPEPERGSEILEALGEYDWLIFTSENGVRCFFDLFFEQFEDLRSLGFLKLAAVGQTTARALADYHLKVDLVPETAQAEALAAALIEREDLASTKSLVITGNRNGDVLVEKMESVGAIVDTLTVYKTELTGLSEDSAAQRFRELGADMVVFASTSAVESFAAQAASLALGENARRPQAASIGPMTSAAIKKLGLPLAVQAEEARLESLVQALVDYSKAADD